MFLLYVLTSSVIADWARDGHLIQKKPAQRLSWSSQPISRESGIGSRGGMFSMLQVLALPGDAELKSERTILGHGGPGASSTEKVHL